MKTASGALIALVLAVGVLVPVGAEGQGNPGQAGRIAALEALVATLQGQVATLQNQVATLQGKLQFVTVVNGPLNKLGGPHLIVTGANVHIRSGSGATDDGGTPTGLGNLIVGYNEVIFLVGTGDRNGAHNLVVGPEHRYTSTGGFVAG